MLLLKRMLVVPLLASVISTSPQIDMDYEGAVDIYTGAPSQGTTSSEVQAVMLPDGSVYDRPTHMFVYTPAGTDGTISVSAASGMITTQMVQMTVSENVTAKLYKNGKELTDADYSRIEEPGKYSVTVLNRDGEQQVMTFTIVGEKTGKISNYTMPSGFTVQSVTVGNGASPVLNQKNVDLSQDGAYNITYRCDATGIDYNLIVEIDHTPPSVTFEGLKDGIARGPVTMTGLEEGDTVSVQIDGDKANAPSDNVFRSVGRYKVTVTDDAGNSVKENFQIRLYSNLQGILFGLLTVAVIAAAGIYMYISRKKLRVR